MASDGKRVGWLFSERYMFHNTGFAAGVFPPDGLTIEGGENHFENPSTKRRFNALLDSVGLKDKCVPLKPFSVTEEDVLRAHTPEYINRLREQSAGRGGDAESADKIGDGTPFGHGSYEIAKLAAGGTSAALDALMAGEVDFAYALVRPPGHHAGRLTSNRILRALA